MTGGTIIILILLGIGLYSIYQSGGIDTWKQNALSNTLDTGKDVTQSAMELFDKDTPVVQSTTPSDAEYVGRPLKEVDCESDGDCIAYVDDCDDCQCDLSTGRCYR